MGRASGRARLLGVLLFVAGNTVGPALGSAARQEAATFDSAWSATVLLAARVSMIENGFVVPYAIEPLGSGAVVSEDGLILTACHVLDKIETVLVNKYATEKDTYLKLDGRTVDFRFDQGVAVSIPFSDQDPPINTFTATRLDDPAECPHDVAVLAITGGPQGGRLSRTPSLDAYLRLGDAEGVLLNDRIRVSGYPAIGFDRPEDLLQGPVSSASGEVTGFRGERFYVSAGVDDGSSGGPVVNEAGELVGIVGSVVRGSVGPGVTSVIPVNLAYPLIERHKPELLASPPASPAATPPSVATATATQTQAPPATETPTASPTATATPTDTPPPPTDTPEPPTEVPTETRSPTATKTEPPPTDTPEPPTDTPEPPTDTPEPDEDPDIGVYESPTYGFTLSYDRDEWAIVEGSETTEGTLDEVVLESAEPPTSVFLSADTEFGGDAKACLENAVEELDAEVGASEAVVSFEPLEEGGEAVAGELRAGSGSYAAYALTAEGDGEAIEAVLYLECRVLEEDESNIGVAQFALAEEFEEADEAREDLLEGLELPGDAGPTDDARPVTLRDDFADEDRGVLGTEWADPDAVRSAYDDGEYVIESLRALDGRGWRVSPRILFSDVTVAVDARLVGERDGRFLSVSCRSTQADGGAGENEYRLSLAVATGYVSLTRWTAGEEEEALDSAEPGDVLNPPSRYNRLQLSCLGNRLTGSLNGEAVVSAEDGEYAAGRVYLMAGTLRGHEGTVEARFDNLVVTGTPAVRGQELQEDALAEVEYYEDLPRGHTDEPVDYEQSPPVGGVHADTQQTCGFYDEPVPPERAVHSMEHGALWVTYDEDLPADEVAILRELAEEREFVLVSPFPGLPAPVVATVWGVQLHLDGADDPRLDAFIEAFHLNPDYVPDLGPPCSADAG